MVYPDTGFLLSLYLPETTTAAATTALRSIHTPLLLPPLTILELRNGLRLAVFRRLISEAQRATCWGQVEADAHAGIYQRVAIPAGELFDRATRLIDTHSTRLGTRTLDTLHVASALHLGAKSMLSFDRRQRALARASGLRALP